jgi:hypothetical protein
LLNLLIAKLMATDEALGCGPAFNFAMQSTLRIWAGFYQNFGGIPSPHAGFSDAQINVHTEEGRDNLFRQLLRIASDLAEVANPRQKAADKPLANAERIENWAIPPFP